MPDISVARPMNASLLQRATTWLQGRAVANKRMRQLEVLTLGPKRCLYMVECDGRPFLVAMSGDSVSAPVPLRAREHPSAVAVSR